MYYLLIQHSPDQGIRSVQVIPRCTVLKATINEDSITLEMKISLDTFEIEGITVLYLVCNTICKLFLFFFFLLSSEFMKANTFYKSLELSFKIILLS